MKHVLYSFLLLVLPLAGFSQRIVDTVHPLFKGKLYGDKIREDFDHYELPRANNKEKRIYNEIILSVLHSRNLYTKTALNQKEVLPEIRAFGAKPPKSASGVMEIRLNQPLSTVIPLFDSADILVTANGINPENSSLYEYRVLQNKTRVLQDWTGIQYFAASYMGYRYNVDGTLQTQMAYLGAFNAPLGNSLTIEVRNKKLPEEVVAIAAIWIKRTPAVIGTFTSHSLREFIEVYKYQWKHDFLQPGNSTYYGDIEMKPVDSLLQLQDTFKAGENSLFFYLKDKVKKANLVEYQLVRGKDSSGWIPNDFDPNIIWLKDLAPGNYQLQMRYSFQRQNTSTYSFQLQAAWYQTPLFRLLLGVLSVLALASLVLLIKNRHQAKKIRSQGIEQQLAQAELKSIRSQFNPHFVFNSLNSIQGLITKNDMDGANKYLTDFSILLRNSLNESQRDFTSLSKEIGMLDNYLKLEQLRFGFSYSIHVDPALDKEGIEVPVLLLQPTIENAVKHGIARKYEQGILDIRFTATGMDLLATITDNGQGFSAEAVHGIGLKLTSDRIDLLNKTMQGQAIDWHIHSDEKGTAVNFQFKNWLV
jgi:hypothetical protein